jgi:spore coat protein A, manganese oxidase
MDEPSITRREALKIGAFGAAALALPLTTSLDAARASALAPDRLPRPFATGFTAPPVLYPAGTSAGRPVYVLRQKQFPAKLLPDGTATQMFGYNGQFPGPTLQVYKDQPVVVRQVNDLPPRHPTLGYELATSTHLHGHPSLPEYDGYANDLTRPGQYKDYLFDNDEAARTIWYHDHAVHHTAENVYMGLAAQYHVLDHAEDKLHLPRGRYDQPLIINDVAFTAAGQLLIDDRSHSGILGDVILVNGRPWPVMQVEPRKYRFRVLDASIARGYRLRLSDGGPMIVIGTDGGLMPAPQTVTEVKIGMAERYDVVIDFQRYRGRRVELRNAGVPNAIDYDNTDKIMAFQVGTTVRDPSNNDVPDVLNPAVPAMLVDPARATARRKLVFERQNGEWVVSGHTWEDVVDSGFTKVIGNPTLGAVEIWELENKGGGWFHPIHIHLVDFRVLDRNGRPPPAQEKGAKDVVYLGENEKIRLVMQFHGHEGRYMIHCHNTTHEDNDMMVQMLVGRYDPAHDPITGAPPTNGPPPAI